MAADVANLYTTSDIWCSSPDNAYTYPPTYHIGLSEPLSLEDQLAVASTIAGPQFRASLQHPSPVRPNALHAMRHNQDDITVSPLEPHFEPDETPATSNNSSIFDIPQPSISRTGEHRCNSSQQTSITHDSISSQTSLKSQSPTTTSQHSRRRRKLENAEPGSARARYLEKNRTAASKCRSKQKRQQEDLVEQAREQGLKNKILKAEVEMLKGGIRELKDYVGQHSNCADARLRLYIQREADRLATGDTRTNPFMDPSAANGGSYLSVTPSILESEGTWPIKSPITFRPDRPST
ncbi:hypothetical protein BDU57DRAFT_532046 [Ampelomyces quisqualis]|uniref:BZIP domain-containing protein n=1 Tax=Ampelomyces quisqualis TaxID=50730 RepID=A0A6A5QDF1_AMPQU|nr:hypothetical protein BDU57DRAFT_532046 [Ampelomyces quisqualis]